MKYQLYNYCGKRLEMIKWGATFICLNIPNIYVKGCAFNQILQHFSANSSIKIVKLDVKTM